MVPHGGSTGREGPNLGDKNRIRRLGTQTGGFVRGGEDGLTAEKIVHAERYFSKTNLRATVA